MALQQVILKLGPRDLSQLRFGFSPLWECVGAFRAWLDPTRHALLLPWLTRQKPVRSRRDWEPLASLATVGRGTIPDFLAPPPENPSPCFAEELERLKAVSPWVMQEETRIAFPSGLPPSLRLSHTQPRQFITQLAGKLEQFWRLAIAPDWNLFKSKLEAEVLFRARALALGGADALFQGLHSDVKYHKTKLTIQTLSHWDRGRRKDGLLLVPSIFAWPDIFLTVRPPWRPSLTYTCRGVAELWSDAEPGTSHRAKQLLGTTAARLLTRLRHPQTTIEIATAFDLSAAAISEQIHKLWRAGVLQRTRVGCRVFYSLNPRGLALLDLLQQ